MTAKRRKPVGVMLAKKFQDFRHRVRYPLYVQPKLDGVRARWDPELWCAGKGFLVSRKGLVIEGVPDITSALRSIKGCPPLDGELYKEGGFDEVSGFARRTTNVDIHHGLTYYVFDIPIASPDFPFSRRWNRLVKLSGQKWPGEIKLVTTWVARSESVVEFILQMCLQEGFEGIMLRDPTSVYTFSRTSALLKYKTWVDDEGIVVDWVEGEGKHVGRLGSLLVQGRGWSSWVGTGFSDTEREKLWAMRTRLKGLIVTVKYQQVTEDQHLRFPRFKRVRKDL